MLALAVICAETDQEARHIAGTAAYRKMMTSRGSREALLPPEIVAKRVTAMNASDRELFNASLDDMVVGSPGRCRREIKELAAQFGCEEIGIVTVTYSFKDRLRSYQLLA